MSKEKEKIDELIIESPDDFIKVMNEMLYHFLIKAGDKQVHTTFDDTQENKFIIFVEVLE